MNSTAPIHQSAFVSAFVIPDKKDRYSEFLQKPKRRQEILNRFNHFFDFLPALSMQIKRTSAKEIANLLRTHGAGSTGYIIGGSDDAACLPLEEAI